MAGETDEDIEMKEAAIRHFHELTRDFGLEVATATMQPICSIAMIAGQVGVRDQDVERGKSYIEHVKRILTEMDEMASR